MGTIDVIQRESFRLAVGAIGTATATTSSKKQLLPKPQQKQLKRAAVLTYKRVHVRTHT
jgi:hypothetical protein